VTEITITQRIIAIRALFVARITNAAAISVSKWKTTRYKPLTSADTLKA
jgi:hypothetical protein